MTGKSLDSTLGDTPGLILETRSGITLQLRPVTPDDGEVLTGLFKRVSPEDLRFRFFSGTVSEQQIASMLEVDHRHSEHVLAYDTANGELAASLMVLADDHMETAEVAIAVAQEYTDKGAGWALLRHAADLARERGIKKLRSIEDRANHKALEVEQALGFFARDFDGDPSLVIVEADLTLD
ncbi:acetyltransferase [Altererythrobacter atlanticus]|uniref:Acetyltransferase (GNAT) family protein n=1 Tax=Croceibacterium atlanticum TaxID=1267766 RepID=A0A0F7KTN7_9SPHN|nr:GNAT family N-acetyltransferase [Croceibacterium atlanticum]AKH43773.1 Acetyltransferase (GNAT) family protein [Croceibacterium atlanticum]MBB5733778.1 acetyltransferase [Croceibacterium atlanticum]